MGNMTDKLNRACVWARIRLCKAQEKAAEFLANQDGVSNVVATIVVLLITVLLIAAFWEQLKEWIDNIMDQIFSKQFTGLE